MEGEKEGRKHQCVVASCVPPPGDLAYLGMCPDRELNLRLVRWLALNPLSHTSQGRYFTIKITE